MWADACVQALISCLQRPVALRRAAEMERLTVSIVNYRTPLLVNECVASLKRFPPHDTVLDIVVVDNASGDHSLEIIGQAHPDVRLIDAGGNLGFAAGTNLALRNCSGDWALLLNSDAQVVEGSLDVLLQALRDNPQVAAASACIVNASDGAEQDFPYRFPTLGQMIRRAIDGPQYPCGQQSEPMVLERLHGACMMIRCSALRSVGPLDSGFFMYDEDVDWCVRARKAGWLLWLVPGSRVLHHGGSSSNRAPSGQRSKPELSDTALRMRLELRRSRYRLYRKHRSVLELCTLKLLTDLTVLASSLRPLTHLLNPSRRDSAVRALRANGKILGLNPFVMKEAVDVGS